MVVARGTAAVCATALLLAMAACSDSDTGGQTEQAPAVRLYGTDGNMSNSFGAAFHDKPGLLAGMKGTTPLTQLSDDVKRRLRSVSPGLNDFTYAAESYDAVVISALAAELAGTTTPKRLAEFVNGVTAQGQQCGTVADCLRLAKNGTDLQYRGMSLRRGGFTDAGEPSTASYGTLHFGADDQLDEGKTEFVGAGDESTTTTSPSPVSKGAGGAGARTGAPLVLGGLLPETGDLSLMYPPLLAGVRLAVKEINEAGGVLGKPVTWIDGDDGTSVDVAQATVRRHIDDGVDVIIGAAASSITRAVLPTVVGAQRVLFSPSNTAADLSNVDDKGLYFRTAPSDVLQGRALADVILRDGAQRIAVVARGDDYGTGLQRNVREELERAGVSSGQISLLTYQPQDGDGPAPDMTDQVAQIKSFGADAVVVIGFGESAALIRALDAAGVSLIH